MKRLLFIIASILHIITIYAQSHWEEVNSGLDLFFGVSDFSTTQTSMYAAGTWDGGATQTRIYKTGNEGETWTRVITTGLTDLTSCSAFESIDDKFYVSGNKNYLWNKGSVYTSTDYGVTWVESNSGLPDEFVIVDFEYIAGEIFACGNFMGDQIEPRIYQLSDNGSLWQELNTAGLEGLVTFSAMGNYNGMLIVFGYLSFSYQDNVLYYSSDNGQTWGEFETQLPIEIGVKRFCVRGGDLYAFGASIGDFSSRFYKLSDGGSQWEEITLSGVENHIGGLAICCQNDYMFIAITKAYQNYSVYRSELPELPMSYINLQGDLDFDDVTVNMNQIMSFVISNDGNKSLLISSITYPEGFSGSWQSGTIPAGGSKEVEVTFSPTEVREYTGVITVHSNAGGGENTLNVSGTGLSDPTSMNEDPSKLKIKVYPNPAKENICIEVEEEFLGEEFQLVDVVGLVQKKDILIGKKTKIAIGHLSPGMYLLTINNHPELSRRVIIQ